MTPQHFWSLDDLSDTHLCQFPYIYLLAQFHTHACSAHLRGDWLAPKLFPFFLGIEITMYITMYILCTLVKLEVLWASMLLFLLLKPTITLFSSQPEIDTSFQYTQIVPGPIMWCSCIKPASHGSYLQN